MDSQSFDFVADKTVRAPSFEAWGREEDHRGALVYDGPDLSTAYGAAALARRLETYWRERGEARTFTAYPVDGVDDKERAVFGVRDDTPPAEPPRVNVVSINPELLHVGPPPRAYIKAIIHETLKLFPGVEYRLVMRHRTGLQAKASVQEFAARAACMVAINREFPNMGIDRLAQIFGVHHTSVLHAISPERRARANECHRRNNARKVAQ